MSEVIHVHTWDESDKHFKGVMIKIYDWDVGFHFVPGWECLRCGWCVGSVSLPPAHKCPDDGIAQNIISALLG